MKFASVLSLFFVAPMAFATPSQIQAPVDTIFIPNGFDNNDRVEVILHGDFQNSCSRIGSTSFEFDENSNLITVDAKYLQYGEPDGTTQYCAQVMLPFIESVNLGVLKAGTYQVQYKGHPDVSAPLVVTRAQTESPDDYLYAPAENAWIETAADTGRQSLVLQGQYPLWFYGCQVMKEVRVEKQGNILVVLPITEIVSDCPDATDHTFVYKRGLPFKVSDEGLLHVRTMHSHSLNRFIPPM